MSTVKKPRKPKAPTLFELSRQAEDPARAGPDRPLCQKCELFKTTTNPFINPPPNPEWNGKVLLVGEGPGGEEEKRGRFFVGAAGRVLYDEITKMGLTLPDIELWNSVICRPPKNRAPSMEEIRCCRPHLLWKIQQLKPKVIMGLGASAAKALTNDGSTTLTRTRGRLLVLEEVK